MIYQISNKTTNNRWMKLQRTPLKISFIQYSENSLEKLTKFIFFICYALYYITLTTVSSEEPLAHRFVTYDDHRWGQKLLPGESGVGNYLSISMNVKKVKCAKLCTINPRCRSFNFYKIHCELNTEDAFSLNATFVIDPRSVYIGMTRKVQTFSKK